MLNTKAPCRRIPTCRGEIRLDQGLQVVGILNVTPDSFSDGGRFVDPDAIAAHAAQMEADGAVMIDIGGVSTRPGATDVDESTELARVIPAVRAAAEATTIPLSVDTFRASVMAQAMEAGASVLNDVTALRGDPEMASFLADSELPFILMHMKGTPTARAADADYEDVVAEVMAFFAESLQRIDAVGLDRSRCILDPGLGFDKDTARNLQLLQGIEELRTCDQPLLIGASRKRFIGEVLAQADPCARDWGTAAVTAHLHRHGVELVRVHNVRASVDTIRVLDVIAQDPGSEVIH